MSVILDTRLVVQLAVGAVFGLSTVGKIRDPVGFARGVQEYEVLPRALAFGVGLVLLPLEIFVAVSHLSGWMLETAVPTALAMLTAFGIAVTVNLVRGRAVPCHCFGGAEGENLSARTLTRVLLLLGAEVFLLGDPGLAAGTRLTYPTRVASFADLGVAVLWATIVLIGGLWLLNVPELARVFRLCRRCGFSIRMASSRTQ